jgi:putative aldouronate transport system permease protein
MFTKSVPESKKRINKKLFKKYLPLYLLILIPLLTILVYRYIPMLGVIIAFKDYKITKGFMGIFTSPWVGFENFRRLFSTPRFFKVLANTLIISTYKIVFTFPAPIIFALLLNELKKKLFKRFVQTVSYLPHFLSVVIVYGIVQALVSPTYGLINAVIKQLGYEPVYFMIEPRFFRGMLVLVDLWVNTGWGAIIYLAAITSIDNELYSAAEIDGANKFRKIIHVTMPGIVPIIIILFIFRVGAILNAGFEQVLMFYTPLTYDVGDIIETYIYRMGLERSDYSFSTAAGLFNSVVSLILVLITNKIAHKCGQQGIW